MRSPYCQFTLALALVAAVFAVGRAEAQRLEDGSYQLSTRCWLPYEADGHTLGLFHLADEAAATLDSLDTMSLDDLAESPAIDSSTALKAGEIRDSSLMPRHASAVGLVSAPAGWLGTALRFPASGEASFQTPLYTIFAGRGWQATAEGWFRLDEHGSTATGEQTTPLITYAMDSGRQLTVARLSDGRLAVEWASQALATTEVAVMPTAQWHHIVLQVDWAARQLNHATPAQLYGTAAGLRVLVDGTPVLALADRPDVADRMAVPALAELWAERGGAAIWYGSKPGSALRIIGLVDELRVSKGEREFYPWNRPPPGFTPDPATDTWPYLRDPGDLVLRLEFDGADATK